MIKKGFIARGTTCESCAEIIKRQALKVEGVSEVAFDYATETGSVIYDETKTDLDKILYKIEEKGYTCYLLNNEKKGKNLFGWIFSGIGLLIIGFFILRFMNGIAIPEISKNMGYGLLFVVGLLTGFHCIGMCGGFVVGYTAKDAQEGRKSHKSHLLYGLGKTVSYTVIGALFGLVGSIIAFTPMMRGVAGLLAGTFLVLFGLKMLNVFPILRKIQLKTPAFLQRFVGKNRSSSPLAIGLMNGLMIACGPLQAIYIMAAGTGSWLEGAKLLFVFGLGTLPVMLGFGFFASFIGSKATQKILKASGVIVILLGILMINKGMVLTGTGYDFTSVIASVSAAGPTGNAIAIDQGISTIRNGYQEIRMTVDRNGWTPDKFVLQKGIPVKWVIDGKELNGCNSGIQVPAYNLNFPVKPGEQIIEFTPTEADTIRWSCWMGMIPGTFIIVEDISNPVAVQQEELGTVVQDGVQTARLSIKDYKYQLDTPLKAGVPARVEVDLKTVTGCATSIVIDAFGVQKRVSPGNNILEFTPTKAGTFNIRCSMNMFRGSFEVVEADGTKSGFVDTTAPAAGGSCGGSGGCGCGG
ncbi:MAG TPA: sulfite exporter TauE/SafE family protein [Candidatus Nanoarchaeia archaeon]|nr:sulfite exporter TauE/SafE family protein [Candidatus Nanoarchaeia archaeon]